MTDSITPLGDGWRKNVEKTIIKDQDSDVSADVITRLDGLNALCVDTSSAITIGTVVIKDQNSAVAADVNALPSGDNGLVVETTPSATSIQNIRVQDGDGTDLADVVTRADNNKALCVDVSSDIQIGAVEIKNATSDDRAVVSTDGTDMALTVRANDLDIRDLTFATDTVDVSGSSVTATVTATDLDIRDLTFATDTVDVSGSSVTATVTATDLDIRDLTFATDTVDVSGSDVTATVSATDLDIRDLTFATDTVDVSGSSVTITGLLVRLRENLAGSAGTGSDGAPNRVYTLTTINTVDIVEVFLDGVLLVETSQYTINNGAKTVTILLNVFDTQTLCVFYNS